MSGEEVGLNRGAILGGLGEEMDVHLVCPSLGPFMPQMRKIESGGVILGLAEGERDPSSVLVAADQNVVGPGQCRAADQGIDAVQVTPSGGTAPIMKGLMKGGFGANERRLVVRPYLG